MFRKGWIFYTITLTFASCTYAVKVNMRGSLNLGKEVIDTLSHYLINGYSVSGRRFMNANLDPIPIEVKSASLCKKLDFCDDRLEGFINEYVTSLAKAVEAVFGGIFNEKTEGNLETSIFEKIRGCLRDVRKILKVANDKITDEKEAYTWVGVIKKIATKFQRKSIIYIIEKLDADKNVNEIKKKLTQKLVINVISTEARAQARLCNEYHICLKGLECTKALNTMLERLITLPNDQISKFMKAFYDALPETTLYSVLSELTANEFKVILNDMAYFHSVPTKEILTSIQRTVENRINVVYSNVDVKKGHDIQLVHIILSDMDYIYSRQKNDPFHVFLDYFLDWSKNGGRISSQVKDVVKNIMENINAMSDEIVEKLIDEVRVFLEITVDP